MPLRGTVDIDIALNWSLQALKKAEKALGEPGLVSRLPLTAADVYTYRDEYVRNRNLVAWNFYNPSDPSEQVNVIVTYDLTGRGLKKLVIGDNQVTILNREDLIAMNTASGRAQDNEDVKALESLK